jgi:cell shape-determining protein MreC
MAGAMAVWLRYSKRRLLGVLMTLSLATALFGQRPASYLRQALHVIIAPFGDGGMYVVTSLKTGTGDKKTRNLSTAEIHALQDENEQLRQQNEEMEYRLAAQQRDSREQMEALQHLVRGSFQPRDDIPCELIPAQVVAADSLPYREGRMVNRGTYGGATVGAPVLTRLLKTDRSKELPANLAVVTASALVGRIESGGPFTAYVRLVTDPGFQLQGRILRRIDPNLQRWIKVLAKGAAADEPLSEQNNRPVVVQATGDGKGGLVATSYDYEKILPGDWLMTADNDAYLRASVRVGTVEEVEPLPSAPGQVRLRVKPFENLEALRDVFIVYWKPP